MLHAAHKVEIRHLGYTRITGLAALTPQEHEVLELMARGHSNNLIATTPVTTPAAVAKHVANIFTKLDLQVGLVGSGCQSCGLVRFGEVELLKPRSTDEPSAGGVGVMGAA